MTIILPFDLAIDEMRVLQEYRRIGTRTLTREDIAAIRHPGTGVTGAVDRLIAKGYLSTDESGLTLTGRADEFLAIDVKPAAPNGPGR